MLSGVEASGSRTSIRLVDPMHKVPIFDFEVGCRNVGLVLHLRAFKNPCCDPS